MQQVIGVLRSSSRLIKINPKSNFFTFIEKTFNGVNSERLKMVGPDRLCAEWILSNGGVIEYRNPLDRVVTVYNYNSLPSLRHPMRLVAIIANDCPIISNGFMHLIRCDFIEYIRMHKCEKIENRALRYLFYVRHSLTNLEVSSCHNIEDNGIKSLKVLRKLEKLVIYDLPYVEHMDDLSKFLQSKLAKCKIFIPRTYEDLAAIPKVTTLEMLHK